MKTKIMLLIAGAAIATLSFTYVSTARVDKKQVSTSVVDQSAPAGGIGIDEK
ncbi:MAG TPA: hypothetical protein VK666_00965 [Chryseolinea sp.]|nr:hypothetical protein [Chryseolinea sp.]